MRVKPTTTNNGTAMGIGAPQSSQVTVKVQHAANVVLNAGGGIGAEES
jgi:hypothetical protein